MQRKEYSAGAVKFSFWFSEFRTVVDMLSSGKSLDDIKQLTESDNIFSAATPLRSRQIFTTVSKRILSLNGDYHRLFETGSIETQKLIVIIAIMRTESLFYDFMNEVYREKLIIRDNVLTDADMRIFFLNKQKISEKAAKWTDATIKNISKAYKTYLADAGLLERGIGDRKLIKPLLDSSLISLLTNSGMEPIINILSGKR